MNFPIAGFEKGNLIFKTERMMDGADPSWSLAVVKNKF